MIDQIDGSSGIQGVAWNGPVCHICGQGYLGVHDCDLEPIPCPDNRPGCAVLHYGHKKTPPAKREPRPLVFKPFVSQPGYCRCRCKIPLLADGTNPCRCCAQPVLDIPDDYLE